MCVCVYLQGCSVYPVLTQSECYSVCAVLRSGLQSVLDLRARSRSSHSMEPAGGNIHVMFSHLKPRNVCVVFPLQVCHVLHVNRHNSAGVCNNVPESDKLCIMFIYSFVSAASVETHL